MEAHRKEYCYFNVKHEGKTWHIETAWVTREGNACWYEGIRIENCQAYFKIFQPKDVAEKGAK